MLDESREIYHFDLLFLHCSLSRIQSPLHPSKGQSEQLSANWVPHDTISG